MIWFTADEHYNHENIIKYCNRPFKDAQEMNDALIRNHNRVVNGGDVVYHLGDFVMGDEDSARHIISQLNGRHVFIRGSHDKWLGELHHGIYELRIDATDARHIDGTDIPNVITLCHYAMRMWHKSHYGSIHLFGHSHGRLEPMGRQMDVGVDCWNFYPVSLEQVIKIMTHRIPFDAEAKCYHSDGKMAELNETKEDKDDETKEGQSGHF
jgi:calcineurin-like phosphoesterase family protein